MTYFFETYGCEMNIAESAAIEQLFISRGWSKAEEPELADMVVINKIYGSAREKADSTTVTGKILAEHAKKYHPNVIYAKEFEEAAQIIESELNKKSDAKDGYVFVTMGAGDNFKVGKMVLEKFKV